MERDDWDSCAACGAAIVLVLASAEYGVPYCSDCWEAGWRTAFCQGCGEPWAYHRRRGPWPAFCPECDAERKRGQAAERMARLRARRGDGR